MILRLFISTCLLICSLVVTAQNTFTFSDTVFEIGEIQTFQNIRFELNKPDILADSVCKPFLDSIVTFCIEYPEIRIEVGVHADSRGQQDRSFFLTESRARAMYSYFSIVV
jgi:outer membrane protein OmpA-like peptidoglycan-associated protein